MEEKIDELFTQLHNMNQKIDELNEKINILIPKRLIDKNYINCSKSFCLNYTEDLLKDTEVFQCERCYNYICKECSQRQYAGILCVFGCH